MDIETAQRLNEATSDFYAANARSFSSTRERPWEGWRRLLPHIENAVDAGFPLRTAASGEPFRVLDVGCGNMRFERFLAEAFPDRSFSFACIDNCPPLAEEGFRRDAVFQEADVVELLRKGELDGMLDGMTAASHLIPPSASPFNLSVAFGLMHHVPLAEWRCHLLATLVEHTATGGLIAVAFWQFAKNPKLREKAERTTTEGCAKLGLEIDVNAGDYLLGWQGSTDHFRFCHSFSDEEVDSLVDEAQRHGARVIDSHNADGPDGMSNRYVVLKV